MAQANPFGDMPVESQSVNPFGDEPVSLDQQADVVSDTIVSNAIDPQKQAALEEAQKRGLITDDDYNIIDFWLGNTELGAMLATSAIAEPIAGIAGLAKTITSGAEEGAKTVKGIQEALTYQPGRTKGGRIAARKVGETIAPVVEKVGAGIKATGDVGADIGGAIGEVIGGQEGRVTGEAIGGAGTITAIAAIPELMGLKGSKTAKKLALNKIIKENDVIDLYDDAGKLKPEIKTSFYDAGIGRDEIESMLPESAPEIVQRKKLFEEEGIPYTRGELSKETGQLTTEGRLLESTEDIAAEPFREFKLKQSEKIKQTLDDIFEGDISKEETGNLIQESLEGRRSLLRSQKNDLYDRAAENAKEVGGIPVLTDDIANSIPDVDTFEDLSITSPQSMKSLDDILTKYGLKEPTGKAEFNPTPLTIENAERFRKTLNAIESGDQTRAVSVATRPIKQALDKELDNIGEVLEQKGFDPNIFEPIKEARKKVRTLKTEFSPQSIIGKLIDTKKDGFTQVTEASKVYDKIAGKSTPVESVRSVIGSLSKAGKSGEESIASLQASVIMDLVDAGFGTESRKIKGVKTFNPTAFKRRLKNVGQDKINAIFSNNQPVLRKIRNIDKISSELIPPAGTVPKGSASTILDYLNKLGIAGISTKMPGGAFLVGALDSVASPVKTKRLVGEALDINDDVIKLQELTSRHFPGLAGAFAVSQTINGDINE